jgi:hypothetical protein
MKFQSHRATYQTIQSNSGQSGVNKFLCSTGKEASDTLTLILLILQHLRSENRQSTFFQNCRFVVIHQTVDWNINECLLPVSSPNFVLSS